MYKQTVSGFDSPVISIIFEIFVFLLYTGGLEAVYGTEYAGVWYYVLSTALFAAVSVYIYIATVTKYEYAILDNELILRKFVRKRPQRIYSVKLIRSNCVYCNKGIKYLTISAQDTKHMYIPGFDLFRKKCAVVFVSNNGVRRKLIFKPDKALDEEIFRIKTIKW